MYEIPSRSDVVRCTITREVVEEGADPILVLSEGNGESSGKKSSKKLFHKNNDEIA
jgi:ATP-dependent protease Clp ATPase subunit